MHDYNKHCSDCIKSEVCKFKEEELCPGTTIEDLAHNCRNFLSKAAYTSIAYASWEFSEPDINGNRKPYCTACKEYALATYADYARCKFCPSCGAAML